jgi:hypothetical protein
MIFVKESINLPATPAETFAIVSDIVNWPKWIGPAQHLEPTSPGPLGVGSTFRSVGQAKGHTIELESTITAYEPPLVLAYASTSGQLPNRNRFTLQETRQGCRFTVEVEVDISQMKGLLSVVGVVGGLAEPFIKRALQKQLRQDLQALRRLLR